MLTAHATLAAGWWWMMPGGFPVSHPRFWVNRVFPILVLGAAIAARWASARERRWLAAPLLVAFPALWLATVIAAVIVFPISFRVLWILPLTPTLIMIVMLWPIRRALIQSVVPSVIALSFAVAMGAFAVFAQRGGDAQTHPVQALIPPLSHSPAPPRDFRSIRINSQLSVEPAAAVVNVLRGRAFIGIQPVLTFISRSPDRSWILFARRRDRLGPQRVVTDLQRESSTLSIRYKDDAESMLNVEALGENGAVDIESFTHLPEAIYSHLNTFTELTIAGHRKLEIAFSPCAAERIAVTYGEYPRGLPRRLGYFSADGVFRIVEATSGEKGPFTTLAEGPLRRGEPLTMTFYDEDVAVAAITLDDFTAQADTSLSPTAGWGLPCNAIEFSLQDESPRSAAGIFISLASTSTGKGYDTVGHAPGTYRNRMRVRILKE